MKTTKRIKNPTKDEILQLKELCVNLDCTMSELIECVMKNVTIESLGVTLCYYKHGCHPSEL